MNTKKAIKKIVALGMGATLVGATILGASAANLNNYPDMFIEDGQFDGLIVVGENAKPIDNIGATNIAMGLQAAAVSTTTVCTEEESTSETVDVEDSVKLEQTNSYLNYGNTVDSVVEKLTSADLPDLLADGRYSVNEGSTRADEDYTQELVMTDNVEFVFDQDDREAPEADDYLKFDQGADAFEYVLQFDSAVEFDDGDHRDLEGSTIEIQGQMYTLTEVEVNGNNELEELTFMVGDTLQWITQGETITKTVDDREHTVEMINVNTEGTACGLIIDDTTTWVDVNSQETVNGLTVGVTDAKAVHAKDMDADICRINLGSSELTIEHGREVLLDGSRVDDSTGYLTYDKSGVSANEWTGLNVVYQPRDDLYLGMEDEFVDPVLGNFKFVFGGIEADYEEMEFSVSGDEDGEVVFRNLENKEIRIPVFTDGTDIYLADRELESDKLVYSDDGMCDGDGSDSRICEGATWLLSQDNGLAGLIEVERITDNTDDEIVVELRDLTNDGSAKVTMTSVSETVNIPGFGNVDVELTDPDDGNATEDWEGNVPEYGEDVNVILDSDGTEIKTYNEGVVDIPVSAGSHGPGEDTLRFELTENDRGLVDESTINVEFTVNVDELELEAPEGPVFIADGIEYSESNTDDRYYVTEYGTKLLYDNEDKTSVEAWHPERETRGIAYVAPAGAAASVSVDGSDCYETETVNKIPSSVNKLDTQVSDATAQNVVTVGGPCVNSVSAALLGNPEDCTAGFEPGKSLIQLFENNGNIAMVVAGYNGEDTLLASQVLNNYKEHADKLSGSKVELSGVSVASLTAETLE